MTDKPKPIVIVTRDEADVSLDGHGGWHHGGRAIANERISGYFHSLIRKDSCGYYLGQEHETFIEKVYFPYDVTPLFALRVCGGAGRLLELNTGARIHLDPEGLVFKGEDLYLRHEGDLVKLNENCLLALADRMEAVDGQYFITVEGRRCRIQRDGGG